MLQNRFHASIILEHVFFPCRLSRLFRAATVRRALTCGFREAMPSWHAFKDLQIRHIWKKPNICSPSPPPTPPPPLRSRGGRRLLQRAPLFLVAPLLCLVLLLRPASLPRRPSARTPRQPRDSRRPAPGGGRPSLPRGPAPGESVLEDVSARWVIRLDKSKGKKKKEADLRPRTEEWCIVYLCAVKPRTICTGWILYQQQQSYFIHWIVIYDLEFTLWLSRDQRVLQSTN